MNLKQTNFRYLLTVKNKYFDNILGERENAGYQHFLLFPKCFLDLSFIIQISCFEQYSIVDCKRYQHVSARLEFRGLKKS